MIRSSKYLNLKNYAWWFKRISRTLLCFVIVVIGFFIPRSKKNIIVIGGNEKQFFDNSKYFYLFFSARYKEKYTSYYLTQNDALHRRLLALRLKSLLFPGLIAFWKLLRAYAVVVDNLTWEEGYLAAFVFGAKKVQLWHGVGPKEIELERNDMKTKLKSKKYRLKFFLTAFGRYSKYDILVSTGEFYSKKVFEKSFRYKRIIESGYPRNDIFFRELKSDDLVEIDKDVFDTVLKCADEGKKIVIYMPTFRSRPQSDLESKALNLAVLSENAVTNNYVLVVKLHVHDPNHQWASEGLENVFFYDPGKDCYPLLKLSNVLITDYSSVYMDYLLLNKPILFFPYDFESYKESEFYNRSIDYKSITPGPKCYTQAELLEVLPRVLDGQDSYMNERHEICNKVFKYCDGNASERICEAIEGL